MDRKNILIATDKPFAPVAIGKIKAIVEGSGNQLILLEKYGDHSQLVEAAKSADAMIIRSDQVDVKVLNAGDQLKIVVRAGAGYDNVDLTAASKNGIVVMNTPGQNSNAVAELAIGMMVFISRNGFNGTAGTELRGKTLGIHAYGNVGRLVAEIAQGFGMQVFAFDPYVDAELIKKAGVEPIASVEDMYSKSHFVSLNIPANDQTKASIGKKLLGLMPKGAVLVNTARKEVINEAELIGIMEARPDFRYVSDIAPDLAASFEEKFQGRFFFTPKKMGAQTAEANINAGIAAANQILGYFQNGDTKFQVNK